MTHKVAVRPQLTVAVVLLAGAVLTLYGLYGLAVQPTEGGQWRWSHEYLMTFLVFWVILAVLGAWRGPFVACVLVSSIVAIAVGVAVQVAVVVAGAVSAYALGRLLLRTPDITITDGMMAGIVVYGTMLGLLAHLPVNTPGTWGILFTVPILMGWRQVCSLWPMKVLSHQSGGLGLFMLHCAIAAAGMLHFLVSLMPEIGHDALAIHLFVPIYVAHNKVWNYDAGTYVWAVMPMLVDWLYTAGYLFAGEMGARLVNVGGIFLLASLVYRIGRWVGAGEGPAAWAVLLLLVTPLTFTESSSLFIEGMWSAFVLGGTFALMRLVTRVGDRNAAMLLAGLLLGGALEAKAVTFMILPVLGLIAIIGYHRWFSRETVSGAVLALLVFLTVGAIPYATAYALTGNPVFPFFNGYFQSPLYPHSNFTAPQMFDRGLAWDSLYRMTFYSGNYLEATPGASGFQWTLLVGPAVAVLIVTWQRRALMLALVVGAWLWLTFEQTAYLRYVFPSFALACVLVAAALSVPALTQGWMRQAWTAVAMVTVVLNLMHFHSGTYYGEIDLRVIADPRARDAYIERNAPVRWAANVVNGLNLKQAPVAFFSAPLTAGLKSDALYANWYNLRFNAAVQKATGSTEMGHLLAQHKVKYVVLDERWEQSNSYPFVKEVTNEVARNQTVSVRRLDSRYK